MVHTEHTVEPVVEEIIRFCGRKRSAFGPRNPDKTARAGIAARAVVFLFQEVAAVCCRTWAATQSAALEMAISCRILIPSRCASSGRSFSSGIRYMPLRRATSASYSASVASSPSARAMASRGQPRAADLPLPGQSPPANAPGRYGRLCSILPWRIDPAPAAAPASGPY